MNARFLALLLPVAYRFGTKEVTSRAYDECTALLRAVYASQRLKLPFEGVLLIGYEAAKLSGGSRGVATSVYEECTRRLSPR